MHKISLCSSSTRSYCHSLLVSSHVRYNSSICKVTMEGNNSPEPQRTAQSGPAVVPSDDPAARLIVALTRPGFSNNAMFLPTQVMQRDPMNRPHQPGIPAMQWNTTTGHFMDMGRNHNTIDTIPLQSLLPRYFHTTTSAAPTTFSSSSSVDHNTATESLDRPGQSGHSHTSDRKIESSAYKVHMDQSKKRRCLEGRDQRETSTISAALDDQQDKALWDTYHADSYKQRVQNMKSVLWRRQMEKMHHIDKHGEETEFNGLKFKVASYNILSQDLLEVNRDHLYYGTDPVYLSWGYRQRKLVAEIQYHKPEILCLQEMYVDHYSAFSEKLAKLGYKGVYKKRRGDKMDGCATFYQWKVFDLLLSKSVTYYRDRVAVLDRDNVALILKLQPKHRPTSPPICVANTHLLFNPKRGDVKLAQIAVLLAEIDKAAYSPALTTDLRKPQHNPVIICGDFNSVPHCNLYKLLTMGGLQYEGLLQQTMSGQKERYSSGHYFAKHFLPHQVGITSHCQYLSLIPERIENYNAMTNKLLHSKKKRGSVSPDGDTDTSDLQSSAEDSDIPDIPTAVYCASHPPHPNDLTLPDPDSIQSWAEQASEQSTGFMSHNLKLKSVHNHRRRNRNGQWVNEATTCHNKVNCTVDYIFYSLADCQARLEQSEVRSVSGKEGPLRLTGRLGLVSCEEMDQVGPLPNAVTSSDHVILMAEFVLEDQTHWQCEKCYK